MSRYISESLQLEVATSAHFKCEYCLVHEEDMFFSYPVDHIISIKRSGSSDLSNLAYACSVFNQNKGTDLGTYLPESNRLVRLFHPRRDKCSKHFSMSDGAILPKTRIGEAIVKSIRIESSRPGYATATLDTSQKVPCRILRIAKNK